MKILFVPLSENAIAHTIRSLNIAISAKSRGHTIMFAADKIVADVITSLGFDIFRYGFETSLSIGSDDYYLELRKYEIEAAQEFNPDIVVNDPLFAGYFIYQALGIPYINITNAALLPCYAGRYGYGPQKDARQDDNIYGCYYPEKIIFPRLQRTAKLLGIVPPKTYDQLLSSCTKIFIPSIQEFDPIRLDMPMANLCEYSGPLLMELFKQEDESLEKFMEENSRFAYITFGGSVFNADYYNLAIEAVIKKGYAAVVSLGSRTSLQQIDSAFVANEKVFITKYVPGQRVCAKAVFVVHSGGHETFMQCLSVEAPSITISYNIDQFNFAEAGESLGVSISMRKPPLSPSTPADFQTLISRSSLKTLEDCIVRIEKNYLSIKNLLRKFGQEVNIEGESSSLRIIKFLEQMFA